jgi:hypothetical protein
VQDAGRIWEEHGTGAIMRHTIPADWIASVEYPELDQRTEMFPMFSHLLDVDWELVQQAQYNRTLTVEDLANETVLMRRELFNLVYQKGTPCSEGFDSDVIRIG